ncbi:Negative regulator of the PHO system, putative, partial [Perkinsus marinus ATCC 50983]
ILHRDLKPHNILLNEDCTAIKIADFGLAREVGIPTGPLAIDVVTLWYRSPEAILGATAYGDSLDVWSIGCIIMEMLRGKPFVAGSSPEDQICKIFAILGAPDGSTGWPDVERLPLWKSYMRLASRVVPLSDILPEGTSPIAIDLATRMLKVCPDHRITCEEGLASPYFQYYHHKCDLSKS